MSLCITLSAISQICQAVTGGIARIWAFDPKDWDWTQATVTPPAMPGPYTAVALTDDAALLTPVPTLLRLQFQRKEAELSFTHARNGAISTYTIKLEFKTPSLRQAITTFMQQADAASICCGVGFIVQAYTGKIFVVGELIVNGAEIDVPLIMEHNGSTGTTGKAQSDENAASLIFQADHSRFVYEYSGTVQSLIDLE